MVLWTSEFLLDGLLKPSLMFRGETLDYEFFKQKNGVEEYLYCVHSKGRMRKKEERNWVQSLWLIFAQAQHNNNNKKNEEECSYVHQSHFNLFRAVSKARQLGFSIRLENLYNMYLKYAQAQIVVGFYQNKTEVMMWKRQEREKW